MTRPAKFLLLIWLATAVMWAFLVVVAAQSVMEDYGLPLSWGNVALTAEIALLPPLAVLIFGYLIGRAS